jgi:hypothetical protein
MKTLGRILIIFVVFAALSGLMMAAVNASASTTALAAQLGREEEDHDNRVHLPDGTGMHERGGAGGSRWMLGLVKNVGVMAVLVTIIALPKSLIKKKRKQAAVNQP